MRSGRSIHAFACLLVLSCSTLGAAPAVAEDAEATGRLAPFERLIGGKWTLDGGFYQTFEWAVGKKAVRCRGYFVIEGEPKLVAEGMWLWHPGEGALKGYFVNVDMPVEFIDYTTRFEGDRMVNTLISHSPDGKVETYREIWEFTGDDRYEWSLYAQDGSETEPTMGGTFTRVDD